MEIKLRIPSHYCTVQIQLQDLPFQTRPVISFGLVLSYSVNGLLYPAFLSFLMLFCYGPSRQSVFEADGEHVLQVMP